MCIVSKQRGSLPCKRRYRFTGPDESGSILIYMVVVMLIFGFLGAGMISMFTSSSMMSSGVPNYGRNAEYVAEAGMRYAISELRNDYSKSTISTLNNTPYTIDGAGSFTLNVLGKWFIIDEATHPSGYSTGTITLKTDQGTFPSDQISTDEFDIPASNTYLVNLESYRDAFIFTGGQPDLFTAAINSVTYASIDIVLADSFQANVDEPVCLAVKSASNQLAATELTLPDEANKFFPKEYGSFYVTNTVDEKTLYFYKTMETAPPVKLTGLLDASGSPATPDVAQDDFIILSPRNHLIVASGASGTATSGGANYAASNFRQNVESPQDVTPPAMDLPADVSPSSVSDYSTPAESVGNAVEVSVDGEGNPLITLGGNVSGGSFGSVWYAGGTSKGGVDLCTAGVCDFNEGMRAFFIMDYQGTGDGFTFAIINGDKNTTASTGGLLDGGVAKDGEMMGYAGDGIDGKGLQPPKMALEFDTYLNPDAYDPSRYNPYNDAINSGRNDPGSSDMDYLQFVFWGDTADDLFDDNVHDFGGLREKWEFTNPSTAVLSTPEIASDGTIFVGSLDHYLYAIEPDGTLGWRRDLTDAIYSSATIGNSGRVYIGCDTNNLYDYSQAGSAAGGSWPYSATGSNIRTKPAIGSDGTIYFGTWDNDRYFYAINPDATLKWRYDLGYNVAVDSSPTIGPDGTIYFGSDSNSLYAITDFGPGGGTFTIPKWTFPTGGDIIVKPVVDMDNGNIYFGSFDGWVYALDSSGNKLWDYNTGGQIWSSPDIGEDGTVYIGSDSNYFYALDPSAPPADRVKWYYSLGGDVNSVTVGSDGTIWVGADDNNLYAFDPSGNKLDQFDLNHDVRSKPSEADNGMIYVGSGSTTDPGASVFAITPPCSPENDRDKYVTSAELSGEINNTTNNWLNDNRYWAVRVEIDRETSPNSRGKYEYTLKAWIRQCSTVTCATDPNGKNVAGTYFADTRIEYAAKTPHLEQTVELCSADHDKFETALIGFTEATGGETQNVVIQKLAIGLIRPGDDVITSDTW